MFMRDIPWKLLRNCMVLNLYLHTSNALKIPTYRVFHLKMFIFECKLLMELEFCYFFQQIWFQGAAFGTFDKLFLNFQKYQFTILNLRQQLSDKDTFFRTIISNQVFFCVSCISSRAALKMVCSHLCPEQKRISEFF